MFDNKSSIHNSRYAVLSLLKTNIKPASLGKVMIAGSMLVAGTISFCSVSHAQQRPSTRVQSGRLHSGRITRSFTEPIEQSVAASAEAGIVHKAVVQEGDIVKVGSTLATLNQAVLLESLEIAKARAESTARLDSARSQVELLRSQLEAVSSLVNGGHTNRFEVEQKQSEYQTAYAEYRAAEDELKLNRLEVRRIQAQIGDRTITSPINGVVTEIHKQPGENLSNNEPQYATIVRVNELKVRFYLDADTLKSLSVGQKIKILVGRNQVSKRASVTYVSPIIDPDSGLGRIDVMIDNHDLKLQSGIICFWSEENSTADTAKGPADSVRDYLKR